MPGTIWQPPGSRPRGSARAWSNARRKRSAPSTDEQAAAIATDEDVTLVLAGAGAGKTAVITAKVAHLVRNQGAKPGEILVLAFNKDAAKQVRDRLASADRRSDAGEAPALGEVAVRTFHSFGRRVIADTGVAPTISRFAGDDTLLRQTITRWLKGLPEVLLSFIAYHSNNHPGRGSEPERGNRAGPPRHNPSRRTAPRTRGQGGQPAPRRRCMDGRRSRTRFRRRIVDSGPGPLPKQSR